MRTPPLVLCVRLVTGAAVVLAALCGLGCGSSSPGPAALDTRNDTCAHCRMAVSDARFAAQLVAPGEEPKFFDDLGCLREYLKARTPPTGSTAFVASYRTRAWVAARDAVYLENASVETPMGFHLLAFEDAAGRDADPAAQGGRRLDAAAVFGGRLPGDAR